MRHLLLASVLVLAATPAFADGAVCSKLQWNLDSERALLNGTLDTVASGETRNAMPARAMNLTLKKDSAAALPTPSTKPTGNSARKFRSFWNDCGLRNSILRADLTAAPARIQPVRYAHRIPSFLQPKILCDIQNAPAHLALLDEREPAQARTPPQHFFVQFGTSANSSSSPFCGGTPGPQNR